MSNQLPLTQSQKIDNSFVNVFHAQIDETSQLAVNARDLHNFLQVGRDFNNWVKDRIKQYQFVEGQDFLIIVSKTGKRKNVIKKDYHLTLDMAKELAMIENNEQGRKVRRYFIDCEKKANSLTAQITETTILLKSIDGNLSEAGRYLAIHGKQTKPTLKGRLSELLQKAQPYLPFVEFGGVK
ncbi:antirepressor [Moraxella ovis]|uniref:Antirepressor n=1 Tax=Moraxella ovis TaxID=29433 RepID=A0A378PHQ3_9GAMM|nr:antA/AntB antirepressor family protein [Moraxella ovis]ANB90871.1 antirepressor [Moraxella ovis]STY86315.1 Phage anti-repressor protein [Moraxella ovis]